MTKNLVISTHHPTSQVLIFYNVSLQYKPPLPRKKSGQSGEEGHTPAGYHLVAKTSNFSATYTVSSPADVGEEYKNCIWIKNQ